MITASTPAQIQYMQLATVKGALRLEKAGMKTRGGALRPKWAPILGLKARDSFDVFIATIDKKLAEMRGESTNN